MMQTVPESIPFIADSRNGKEMDEVVNLEPSLFVLDLTVGANPHGAWVFGF